ncbi:transposable element Tcb1 transposase [Trichonephila clavipes]|nr:transposable element Tcb1 transposase [Trichonephila clavipes]
MSFRKQRSAFDQVSEFNRGRIVAYRDCGLSFREISSRVARNQTTIIRICDRWIQEVSARTIRRRLQQSALSEKRPLRGLPLTQNHTRLRHQWCDERRMWVAEKNEVIFTDKSRICLQHHDGRIRVWRHRGERMLNTATLVLHRDNARPHVARIVQRFFVNHQIELLPRPALSPDLPLIKNMWSMVAQRLTQITPPAATPDQLWEHVINFGNYLIDYILQFCRGYMSCRKQRSAFDQVSEFGRGRIVAYRNFGLSFSSERTIRRHLQQSSMSARRPLLGLPLTQNDRRLRRQWCYERRMWMAEWNEVLFTEESSICLQHQDGRIQNNVRSHVARIVRRFFVNQKIELLPRPARSPDLSLIKNMWSMVAQRLTHITLPAATPDQLWERVATA